MYQPYPSSSAQLPESSRPPVPPSVRNAITIMYGGAAASLIGIAIDLATIGSLKANLVKKHHNLTPTQIDNLNNVLHVALVIGGVIGALLWLFIALNCKRGHNWARITGTVLFGIATLDTLVGMGVGYGPGVKLYAVLIWLIGLAVVILLWRGTSSAYFKTRMPA
ncbi:MAG TPA: hypothetical protein VN969_29580 [Streptosporangiaceae bacterium]|jgi:hypothetical protein|nr:hypothetical protein [Streptosporangiaceae bacterium]